MPRCEPIAERYYGDPDKRSLKNYDDDDSLGDTPPIGHVRYDYQILEQLDYTRKLVPIMVRIPLTIGEDILAHLHEEGTAED